MSTAGQELSCSVASTRALIKVDVNIPSYVESNLFLNL